MSRTFFTEADYRLHSVRMAIHWRTKFSDGYLLEKVRAIALAAREPAPACLRIVNLVHDTFPHYSWTGLYLRRDRNLLLAFHRGADALPPEPREGLDGLLGLAVRSRRVQVAPDSSADPRYARIEIPIKSEIAVPLRHRNRVVGVLDICSDQVGGFDRLDADLLEAVGQALATLAVRETPAAALLSA